MKVLALLFALGSTVFAPSLPQDEGIGDPIVRSRQVTEYLEYTAACYERCTTANLHIAAIEPRCTCGTEWSQDETPRLMEKAITYFHQIDCDSNAECSAAWTRMWDEVDLDKVVQ